MKLIKLSIILARIFTQLCTIESGQSVRKLTDIQTSKMIKIAAMCAPDRKKAIKKVVKISYYYIKNVIS